MSDTDDDPECYGCIELAGHLERIRRIIDEDQDILDEFDGPT